MTDETSSAQFKKLGDRIKGYESEFEVYIKPYLPYIIRLDGKNFSKFTKGLEKPFDIRFATAMVFTMNDLVEKFTAKTGYTHSDEITLIFSGACTKEEYEEGTNKSNHEYNGRIIKLCTVIASYCGTRFAYHMSNIINGDDGENRKGYGDGILAKVDSFETCFDARIIVPPESKPGEIVNHMIWRSLRDCFRNAVSTYARSYYSTKQLHKKNTQDMIEMMKEAGFDFEKDAPTHYKYGVYGKKEVYEKEAEIKGKLIMVNRQRINNRMFKIGYSDETLEMLFAKNWTPMANDYEKFDV